MPTVREYYKTDFTPSFRFESDWVFHGQSRQYGFSVSVFLQIVENAKFMAFYFPPEISDGNLMVRAIRDYERFLNRAHRIVLGANVPEGRAGTFEDKGENILRTTYRLSGEIAAIEDVDVPFTGRIFIYTENNIPDDVRTVIAQQARERNLYLVFRDATYAAERNLKERPKAFISHDSRDKEEIARPIATRLRAMGCPVWYDEFSLEVGQSLRESIEHGLKVSKMCVFVLTPNFLAKGGWPKREYQAVFTRELVEERNLILPVWAGVAVREVYDYSPVLADRVALLWEELREEEVCRRLFVRLNQ